MKDQGNSNTEQPLGDKPQNPRTYWQVAAGNGQRDYAEAFIRYGLAFVGIPAYAVMSQVRRGDVMILKRGTSAIDAVGRVVERAGVSVGNGDKPWLRDFDGWQLEAYCNVDWYRPADPVNASGLTRGILRRVQHGELQATARRMLDECEPVPVAVPEPPATAAVTDDQILRFLIERGLRPGAADELTAALRRIRLLARFYYDSCNWSDIREHETRTFLIVPLLQALGWPEQRLKVELGTPSQGRIDIACFARPCTRPTRQAAPNECQVILESKGFEHGLDQAPAQARGYAEHFPTCGHVIVSNGYCYKVFARDKLLNTFSDRPTAYLNLLSPQDAYPLDPANVKGCLAALTALMPPG